MYTEKVRPSPSCSCSCSLERLIMTFPDRQATGLNLTSQGFVYMAIMILMLPFSFFVINILGYKLMYNTVQNVFWLLQFETMIFDNMWLDLEVQCVLISKMSDCFYSPDTQCDKMFFTFPDTNDMCWKLVCGSLMSGQNIFACT